MRGLDADSRILVALRDEAVALSRREGDLEFSYDVLLRDADLEVSGLWVWPGRRLWQNSIWMEFDEGSEASARLAFRRAFDVMVREGRPRVDICPPSVVRPFGFRVRRGTVTDAGS